MLVYRSPSAHIRRLQGCISDGEGRFDVGQGRTVQRICPGRENDAFCTKIGDFDVRQMSYQGLNLATEVTIGFH